MTDDPLTTCPQCQGHIHRVLFPASVVFKGSGFYSTDHRSTAAATEAATPAAKAEGGAESTTATTSTTPPSTSTATESKPAAAKD